MFSPAQLTGCLNLNYVVDPYLLSTLSLLTQKKLSELIEVITVVMVMVCKGVNFSHFQVY